MFQTLLILKPPLLAITQDELKYLRAKKKQRKIDNSKNQKVL